MRRVIDVYYKVMMAFLYFYDKWLKVLPVLCFKAC